MLSDIDEMIRNNRQKFSEVKKLGLPLGQYAITGSGALGIRNLRAIGDIDIIVAPKLWESLVKKYGLVDKDGVKRVVIPGGLVEAFGECSYAADTNAPTITDRIARAEQIDGLPFESLADVLYYKRKMGREKDLRDIRLIEKTVNEKPCFEVRAFIQAIEQATSVLLALNATFKSDYAFTDYIYFPLDREHDFNKEFIRLRVYQKTNWNQMAVELVYKLKLDLHHTGRIAFKKQFSSMDESEEHLKNHKLAFSYSRRGSEYALGDVRIFVEEVDGLSPSIEIVSGSKEILDQIFEKLVPLQILSDSIPKLVERTHAHST